MTTCTLVKLSTGDYTVMADANAPTQKVATVEQALQLACDLLEAEVPDHERELVVIYRPKVGANRTNPNWNE